MKKYLISYYRLSLDDGESKESNSIISQRRIVTSYIQSASGLSGMTPLELADDGYSGTNFNRPGVKRMLELVKSGEAGCIVVKDFSRFGRHYLEVSKYIEYMFPYLGVRFIAVNDGYDSLNHAGTTPELDVPVRNMLNAMYSRDISQKVRSAKRTQARQGVFSNAFAPYGYIIDPADRHRLLVDRPAAQIVRRIFALAYAGYSSYQIAVKLNSDGLMTPSQYKKTNGSKLAVGGESKNLWTVNIVSRILRDERYAGVFIGGRHETLQVGSGKKRHVPKESWIRIPGGLPAIVTPELFNAVSGNRPGFGGAAKRNRVLYKRVRCGRCGHLMQYIGSAQKPYYLCDTARYTDEHGCKRDRIRERDIIDTVKKAVYILLTAFFDSEEFVMEDKSMNTATQKPEFDALRLQASKRRLYERYKSGQITLEDFLGARQVIDADIEAKTPEVSAPVTRDFIQTNAINPARQFFEVLQKYQAARELPDELMNELAEAVYVHDADRLEVRLSFRLCDN